MLGFGVRVKHTVGVTNAEGSFFYMKSLELIQVFSVISKFPVNQVKPFVFHRNSDLKRLCRC
jgi:hypothetical protein